MLHEFLSTNRTELIRRCRAKVAKRFGPAKVSAEIDHGVPLFLQQMIDTLRCEQLTTVRANSDPEPAPSPTEIGRAAALHGIHLLRRGFTIDQVVHDYGDVCQAVTEMAVEQKAMISADEFRTLNRCIDNAIADAVASFGNGHQTDIAGQMDTLQGRLNAFSVEHGRLVDIAFKAYAAIGTGRVGLSGATGALLLHTLSELGPLIDRLLPEIRQISAAAELPPVARLLS